MKKTISFILSILLIITLALSQPTFGFVNYNKRNDSDLYKNELIISFGSDSLAAANNTIRSASVGNEVKSADSVIASLGLEIVDTLSLENNSSNGEVSSLSLSNNSDSLYLVKYDESDYKNSTQAIKKIKKQLENSGLDINYIEPNYPAYVSNYWDNYNRDNDYNNNDDWDDWDDNNYYDSIYGTIQPNGLNNKQEWNYSMINLPEAWKTTSGDKNVVIAVLDTGVDYNHPDLKDFINTSLGKSYVTEGVRTYPDFAEYYDGYGHGTHVAGIIASSGRVTGVMKNATLIPIKVLDDSGRGGTYGIIQAVKYAADCGAHIINMSLTIGDTPYQTESQGMRDACNYASNKGTLLIAATGNNGKSNITYPAKYDNVIAVGALNSHKTKATFSQYGDGIDIVAPGEEVFSTFTGQSYLHVSGTSMATPHVTGVAGLIKSANFNLTAKEIEDIILSTAESLNDTFKYGNGVVDAKAAVEKALTMGGSPVPVEPEDPFVPVEPEDPFVPVEPEDPFVPVEPEDPFVPVEPEDPFVPIEPEDPFVPIEPEDPFVPIEPEDPFVPVEPEDPFVPVEPEDPFVPVEPEDPFVPVEPEDPYNPTPHIMNVTAYMTSKNSTLTHFFDVYEADYSSIVGARISISIKTPSGRYISKVVKSSDFGDATVVTSIKGYGTGVFTATYTVEKEGYDTQVITKSIYAFGGYSGFNFFNGYGDGFGFFDRIKNGFNFFNGIKDSFNNFNFWDIFS